MSSSKSPPAYQSSRPAPASTQSRPDGCRRSDGSDRSGLFLFPLKIRRCIQKIHRSRALLSRLYPFHIRLQTGCSDGWMHLSHCRSQKCRAQSECAAGCAPSHAFHKRSAIHSRRTASPGTCWQPLTGQLYPLSGSQLSQPL